MDTVVVVVMDMLMNSLNQLTRAVKAVDITKFIFEAPKERLTEGILPRGSDIADRDLDAKVFEEVGAGTGHKFVALIGMKDTGLVSGGESLVEGR